MANDKNLGGIEFTIGADTTGIDRANESMEKAQQTAKDTSKSVDGVNKSLDGSGKSATEAAKQVDKYGNELTDADKAAGRFIDSSGRMREANGRFVKSTELAARGTKGFKGDVDGLADSLRTGLTAATAFAAGIGVISQQSAQAARDLQVFAQISGTSVEEFQKLAFGAKNVGIESEQLAQIFQDVQDRVGDFLTTGGGEMADYFEQIAPKIGQTAEQFRGLSGPQALGLFKQGLDAANLSAEEQIFYLESIASDATRLQPLLAENGRGFQEAGRRADELNVVLSQFQIDELLEVDRAFNELGATVSTSVQAIVAENAPDIIDAVRSISEAIAGATQFIEENMDTIKSTAVVLGSGAAAWYAYRAAIMVATTATKAFTAATLANPVGLLIAAAGTAIGLMSTLSDETDSAAEATDWLRRNTENLTDAQKENARVSFNAKLAEIQAEIDLLEKVNDLYDSQIEAGAQTVYKGRAPVGSPDTVRGEISENKKRLSELRFEAEKLESALSRLEGKKVNTTIEINRGQPIQAKVELMPDKKLGLPDIMDVSKFADTEFADVMTDNLTPELAKALGFATKEGLEEGTESFPSDFAMSIGNALATGDYSGFADMLSSQVAGSIGTFATDALTPALGTVAGGMLGGVAGGMAGAVVDGLLSGKQEISRSVSVVFEDGIAQAFTNIEYDSMFGGSSSILNFTQVENERVTNSFRNMARDLGREFDSIGLAVGDLSGTFEGESVSDALSNAADDYVNAGFESIDMFQEFGENAVDAFGRIVDQIETMQDGLLGLTDRGVQESIDRFIQGRAEEFNEQAELGAGYWETSIVALRDLAAGANEPLEAAAGDLIRGTAEYERVFNEWLSRRSGSTGNFMFQTQNVLDEAEGHIAWIEANQLPEAIGRLDEGMTVATASFAETLENAVEGDLASAFQAMADVTATESENLATQLENARDAIEALGFDRDITNAQFSAQLAAAQVEPISAEALANFLNAAIELERISELTEEFTGSLAEDVDSAFDTLRRAIDAERDALTKKYNAEREAAQDVLETMRDGLSNLETVANSLKAAIEQAVDESASVQMARLAAARAEIEGLAAAGVLPDSEALDELLGRVTGDNAKYYATAEDYYTAQGETANDIAKLSKLADDQLSEAEQQIKNQEELLELMEDNHKASLEALESQLDVMQMQYDALLGIDNSLLSVVDAVSALAASLSAFEQSQQQVITSPATISNSDIRAAADQIYSQNVSNGVVDWDAAEAEIARQAIANNVSAEQLASSLGVSVDRVIERANELGVPLDGSHANGLGYVPFDGYRAELHRGEMVLPAAVANDVREMSSNGAIQQMNANMVGQMNEMTDQNRRMAADMKRMYNLWKPLVSGNILYTYDVAGAN